MTTEDNNLLTALEELESSNRLDAETMTQIAHINNVEVEDLFEAWCSADE
tara:strand:+ start:130 stop:279 length:150 start_codon:yes stop_codon:yes gene_type:complete